MEKNSLPEKRRRHGVAGSQGSHRSGGPEKRDGKAGQMLRTYTGRGNHGNKFISVRWVNLDALFPVDIEVKARDVVGIYLKIIQCISGTKVNMTSAQATRENNMLVAKFPMEVDHSDTMNEIMVNIESLPEVEQVTRVS